MRTNRRRSAGMAECEQCDKLAIDASRAKAIEHASEHGHLVHFLVEDTSTYDGREEAPGAQE